MNKERILINITRFLITCLIVTVVVMIVISLKPNTVTVTGDAVQSRSTITTHLTLAKISAILAFLYNVAKEILTIAFLFFGTRFFIKGGKRND